MPTYSMPDDGTGNPQQPEPEQPAPTVPCARCGQPAMVDALPDDPTERLCLACWRLVGMRDAVRGWHHKYTDWPGGRQPSRNLLLPGHYEAEFDETVRRAWQRPNPWDSYGEWDM